MNKLIEMLLDVLVATCITILATAALINPALSQFTHHFLR